MTKRRFKPKNKVICKLFAIFLLVFIINNANAATYAAMVVDARTGEALHSKRADTRLHPASLTKMMTLYIAFEAIENGEISPDKKVRISRKAALEPPSKLGLKEGQRIKLRYLIRAAAIRSANDAATAIGEALEGSEAAFARRMNRTAKALGMTRTTFKNAHGLTETGHLSTARDMTTLGRHLFYDFPDYYHLFSRLKHDAGMKIVPNTNRRFLKAYKGADGIKTGYTRAAGFNLVASAERGNERIIATVFGGKTVSTRNAQIKKLLDLGFNKAPSTAALKKPLKPNYDNVGEHIIGTKYVQLQSIAKNNPRPFLRPEIINKKTQWTSIDLQNEINVALVAAHQGGTSRANSLSALKEALITANVNSKEIPTIRLGKLEVVSRLSTHGDQGWSINVGRFTTSYAAEKMLLKTALTEIATLEGASRKVVSSKLGFEATFLGLTKETAERACRRLTARNVNCQAIGPS